MKWKKYFLHLLNEVENRSAAFEIYLAHRVMVDVSIFFRFIVVGKRKLYNKPELFAVFHDWSCGYIYRVYKRFGFAPVRKPNTIYHKV